MNLRLSNDARPQAMTLLAFTAISLVLWYIPFAWLLYYPFEIFVTFIHEGGHALAAVLTGRSVNYIWVATNTAGQPFATVQNPGVLSQMFVSSAGYLGAMAYGALLLVLIRKAVAARIVLLVSGLYIFALTMIFEVIKPILS